MNKKSKPSTASFKWNGTEQAKVLKLLIVFVAGHFLFWLLCSGGGTKDDPKDPPSFPRKGPRFQDSLMISLPIRFLAPEKGPRPIKMSLKHESKDILIPEVFVHTLKIDESHRGMGQIEIRTKDLQAILKAGESQEFIAFPWSPGIVGADRVHSEGRGKKEDYEIHLD
ncbi:MAG: hypothetical protein OXB88_07610 [Bacteriovoracales bacterium]|nr:hypothetical protein [Bacteriovoracales bacterium]